VARLYRQSVEDMGALKRLAQLQATELDEARDAEPGKIPHEIRFGELAHFHRVPHTPYYGTADATPLYLIVLHEAWTWLGDDALLRAYREPAKRCLEWIDRYGDLDGDGFQEYRTLSAENPAYNPLSYQWGSVWPHDNGIIALGFKRYGFAAEAARVVRGVVDAAACFASVRRPEARLLDQVLGPASQPRGSERG
jgi:glycogen debranching enzyme